MEFTLLAAALTSALALWLGVKFRLRRGTYRHPDKPFDVLLGSAGVGVFTGRVAQMLMDGVNPVRNPVDVLLVRAGVDTVTATVAALITLAWVYREDLQMLDIVAPAALLGLSGWHAGCIWTNSCLGAATGSDVGFTLPGSTVARHPTELYAAAALAVSAYFISRARKPFVATGLSLAAAGGVRAATQPIRPSLSGGPLWAYLTAVAVGLVVVGWTRTRAT